MSERTGVFLEAVRSVEDSIERVQLAESLGYESVWSSHIAGRDPMHVFERWAAATGRIGFATRRDADLPAAPGADGAGGSHAR